MEHFPANPRRRRKHRQDRDSNPLPNVLLEGSKDCMTMDKLSDDLKLEIVSRLSMKMLGCFMCVSKPWHNLITTSHLPIKFYGIATREENCKAATLLRGINDWYRCNSDTKFQIPDAFGPKTKWLDYCNGLFLFWHRVDNSLPKNHYVVFNPLTKQYVAIDKPTSRSRDKDYAVLAYDSYRSNYFKIVRFESSTNLKVFFSETGSWDTLLYQLPDLVTKADWVKQCAYFKGALYRLSASGHLLRFELDLVSNSEAGCAKVINLPNEIERSKEVEECVGVLNGQLSFCMSVDLKFRIWELQPASSNPSDGSYQWSLKYAISCNSSPAYFFKYDDKVKRVTMFHPYLNIVYSSNRRHLDKGNGFPLFDQGFCLTDQTSFEVRVISEMSRRSRKRLHFHPIVLCLSQFASNGMDTSQANCQWNSRYY